jgi:hypothetical protein
MRDGRFIETKFRHQIPRANIKDAGPYICSAENGLGQVPYLRGYIRTLLSCVLGVLILGPDLHWDIPGLCVLGPG